MSHANGQVKFPDGVVFYYEYNGTVDIAIPALWALYEDMQSHWRKQPDRDCICGKDEPVEIATDYGSGFYWPGRACRNCMVITSGYFPNGLEGLGKTIEPVPEWWEGNLPEWWVDRVDA